MTAHIAECYCKQCYNTVYSDSLLPSECKVAVNKLRRKLGRCSSLISYHSLIFVSREIEAQHGLTS